MGLALANGSMMINCQHLDNYRRCRVHRAPAPLRWLMPKGRPLCVFEMPEPQDGKITCAEQVEHPRPTTPAPRTPK
jgi:hypothetical protein